MLRLLQKIAAVALSMAPLGAAHAHAEVGTVVANVELRTATGGREKLLAPKMKATAVVFVRTGQDRSQDALRAMARCEQDLAGKPIRFVAVVSGETSPADAAAMASGAGVRMPVLLDDGDALYARLDVRNHPVVFLLDARNAIAGFEQYRQIDYCEVLKAKLRQLLGEIDQAAVDKVLNPQRGAMPGEDVRDVSNRDVQLGRKQLKIKQYEKAIQSANKALAKAPSAGAFALLGDVYAAQGDCAKAQKQYEQALKLDAGDKHAVAGLKACAPR